MSCAAHFIESRTPVILITGFLGSGKTTLVNKLLKLRSFENAAVVVNEFGETSVDHHLITAPRARLRVIDSGCLCGHVHEEVASSLLDLAASRRNSLINFDFVLIETSGLGDPVPIIQILLTDPHVSSVYEMRAVLTVADGVHGLSQLTAHKESVKQVAVADVLVISKADIASTSGLKDLGAELAAINPGARQIFASGGDVDQNEIIQTEFDPSHKGGDAQLWLNDVDYAKSVIPASADPSIATFTLNYDQEIMAPGLVLWLNLLAGFRGAGLLRVKGIVNVEGRPYAIQAVQTIVSEPAPLDDWPDEDRRSRLVFVTRGMSAEDLKQTFSTFAFDAGRAARNTTISPTTYAEFAKSMKIFRSFASEVVTN